jgi:hypothetical protein
MNFDIFTPADVFKDKLKVITMRRTEINKSKINANLITEYPKMNELPTSCGMVEKTTRFIMLSKLKIMNNNLS